MLAKKNLRFDCYLNNLKVQGVRQLASNLSDSAESVCGVEAKRLSELFLRSLSRSDRIVGGGAAVIDIKSPVLQKSVLMIANLDQPIDLRAIDQKPVDIVVAVLSPQSESASHLQQLARISRLLRSKDLRVALRDAKDEDSMRVLFLPKQSWMEAA